MVCAWNMTRKKSGVMTLPVMKEKLAKEFLPKQKQMLGPDFPK